MERDNILITGSAGQLGSVLYEALCDRYGTERIIASDITESDEFERFTILDIMDSEQMAKVIEQYKVGTVYHLAAMLSARGEQKPLKAWDININGYLKLLECARHTGVRKIFFPSSIGVFGSHIPLENTPQHVPLYPATVYGISKSAGENWGLYYFNKYGLDVRGIRYPGVIGYQSMPGGGTTDYAVEIFHQAILNKKYTCFLKKDERLPMIYMDDAIRATLQLMESPADKLGIRTAYNIQGMSFSPEEIAAAIRAHIPDFEIKYEPDYRQEIASSWPDSIDDSEARSDWGWAPKYDLNSMCKDMLEQLTENYSQ